jgi:transposase
MNRVLAEMDTARHAEAADPGTPAPARKVLATLDHEWDGLARHREYPELALDNNTAERGLRPPVVGRKNYYGSGSVASAELAGRAWTSTDCSSILLADRKPGGRRRLASGRDPGLHRPWVRL